MYYYNYHYYIQTRWWSLKQKHICHIVPWSNVVMSATSTPFRGQGGCNTDDVLIHNQCDVYANVPTRTQKV